MKLNTYFFFRITILIFLFVKTSSAQWSGSTALNTLVCNDLGKQIDLRMSEDGKGGAFLVWEDYRSSGGFGLPDIYIQYLDSAGYPHWEANGIGLCKESSEQSTPAIVTDMSGGVIVAWSDWRSGIERDIYAQRINAQGLVMWTIDGVGVANKLERENNAKIISDGAGGAIIVWEQLGNSGLWDLFAQRIDSLGAPVWQLGGLPICTVNAQKVNPKIQKDGKGGAIITWQDYRNLTDYDIYAQRLSPTGALLWGVGAKAICSAQGAQVNPKIDPDSITGGAYIVWIDKRNLTDYDIYAQKLDENGNILWAIDGLNVTNAIGNQSSHDILSNGSITNGLIVTWKDNRSGELDIYAQKLSPVGIKQWGNSDTPICNSPSDQLNPNIVDDAAGGAIIVWEDYSSFIEKDIKSQRINSNGIIQWDLNGVFVSNAIANQSSPKNITDNKGGAIFAWQDKRNDANTENDIYAHHLYADGSFNMSINEKIGLPEIIVFPNPFIDDLNILINLKSEEFILVHLHDILGRQLSIGISKKYSSSNESLVMKIETEKTNLPAGIYFLKVNGANWTKTIKVIKGK